METQGQTIEKKPSVSYGLDTYASYYSNEEVFVDDEYVIEEKESLEFPGENSIIPEVAATIPVTDDPKLPALTFRVLLIGSILNVASSVITEYFFFRLNSVQLNNLFHVVIAYPLGVFYSKIVPALNIGIGQYKFSLNPGPFTIKEHTLIVVIASSAINMSYGMILIITKRLFYNSNTLAFIPAISMLISSQCMGFGLAGLLHNLLVAPAKMWWPENLVIANLLVSCHSVKTKAVTSDRIKWFGIFVLLASIYQLLPSFFMTSLQAVAFVCLIGGGGTQGLNDKPEIYGTGPPSEPGIPFISQIVSGFGNDGHGGVGVLSFDWNVISALNPLFTPWWAQLNALVGNYLFTWVTIPLIVYYNFWNAKLYPAFSTRSFQTNGSLWDISNVLDNATFKVIPEKYANYQLRISPSFALFYGLNFAILSSVLTYMLLYYSDDIRRNLWPKNEDIEHDIHTKMMAKYKHISKWVYLTILVCMTAVGMFVVEYYNDEFTLKWWGILLALVITLIFVVPIGIIRAISNTSIGLNVLSQILIGYLQPGSLANLTFKVYGTNTLSQTLTLLADLKLGHYLKIPPRHMFFCQIYGAILAAIVNYEAFKLLIEKFPEILTQACIVLRGTEKCPALLDPQWGTPVPSILYTASVLWGVVGPQKLLFDGDAPYKPLLWFIPAGIVLSILIYALHRFFPKVGFNFINLPIIFEQINITIQGYGSAVLSGTIVGFLSQVMAKKHYRYYYDKYNYILSASLDFSAILIPLILIILARSIKVMQDEQGNPTFVYWGLNPNPAIYSRDYCYRNRSAA